MRRLTYLVFSFAAVFLLMIYFSCDNGKDKDYYKYQGEIQGTYFSIIYEADKDYAVEMDSLLESFNESLNNYDSLSTISKINYNQTKKTDSLFRYMYTASREVWKESGGMFDITIAPLANMWGFGYRNGHIPDSSETDSVNQFTGMDKTFLKEDKIIKSDDRLEFISNAIAQGMSVDYIAKYFDKMGIENYLIDIGGEIGASGKSTRGDKWIIGIDKPVMDSLAMERNIQEKIKISENSVATSGNYRKYKEVNGKIYGHSINPVTGYPVKTEILSATVIYPECIYADAWATAFMLLGEKEALRVVNSKQGMEAMFITGNNMEDEEKWNIVYSDGFRNFIEKD